MIQREKISFSTLSFNLIFFGTIFLTTFCISSFYHGDTEYTELKEIKTSVFLRALHVSVVHFFNLSRLIF